MIAVSFTRPVPSASTFAKVFRSTSLPKVVFEGANGKMVPSSFPSRRFIIFLAERAYYDTTADNITWFCNEAEAQAAGYQNSKKQKQYLLSNKQEVLLLLVKYLCD